MNIKVSFDFDDTLSKKHIQKYAKELVDRGFDVWIHTLRISDKKHDFAARWNDDLYEVAKDVGIPNDKIIFCERIDKWEFIKDNDFLWHIDDDYMECVGINKNTNTIGICHFGNSTWRNKCERLIKKGSN